LGLLPFASQKTQHLAIHKTLQRNLCRMWTEQHAAILQGFWFAATATATAITDTAAR
jgi:hypothetical protein